MLSQRLQVTTNNCAFLLVKKVSTLSFQRVAIFNMTCSNSPNKNKRMRIVWYVRANGTKSSFVAFQILYTKWKKKKFALPKIYFFFDNEPTLDQKILNSLTKKRNFFVDELPPPWQSLFASPKRLQKHVRSVWAVSQIEFFISSKVCIIFSSIPFSLIYIVSFVEKKCCPCCKKKVLPKILFLLS